MPRSQATRRRAAARGSRRRRRGRRRSPGGPRALGPRSPGEAPGRAVPEPRPQLALGLEPFAQAGPLLEQGLDGPALRFVERAIHIGRDPLRVGSGLPPRKGGPNEGAPAVDPRHHRAHGHLQGGRDLLVAQVLESRRITAVRKDSGSAVRAPRCPRCRWQRLLAAAAPGGRRSFSSTVLGRPPALAQARPCARVGGSCRARPRMFVPGVIAVEGAIGAQEESPGPGPRRPRRCRSCGRRCRRAASGGGAPPPRIGLLVSLRRSSGLPSGETRRLPFVIPRGPGPGRGAYPLRSKWQAGLSEVRPSVRRRRSVDGRR